MKNALNLVRDDFGSINRVVEYVEAEYVEAETRPRNGPVPVPTSRTWSQNLRTSNSILGLFLVRYDHGK